MTRVVRMCSVMIALLIAQVASAAQPDARGAGHWEGTIQANAQDLQLQFDLRKMDGKWNGTLSVPAQQLKGMPLSAIAVEGDTVTLSIALPGDPQFKGTLSADGRTLSGDFTQHGASMKLVLTRTGDAMIEALPKSTPISKDLEGAWEGALDVKGTQLRLVLKLANRTDGVGGGVLVSVDQGGAEVPISAVVQAGTQVKLLLPVVAGGFEGELKDGTLVGTWTQGPLVLPLTFKRAK